MGGEVHQLTGETRKFPPFRIKAVVASLTSPISAGAYKALAGDAAFAPNTMDASSTGSLDFLIHDIFGPLVVGTCFSLILYGGIAHQTIRYYQTYSDDRLWLKVLVLSMLALESGQTASCIDMCYYFLIANSSNWVALTSLPLSFKILPVFTGLIIMLSQAFFIRRAFFLGRTFRILIVLVAMLSFGQCALSMAALVNSLTASHIGPSVSNRVVLGGGAVAAAAADIIMTVILTVSLRRSKTGLKSSDSIMDSLILYSITTGLLTSASMLVFTVLAIILPQDTAYLGLSFVITKLYMITLLAALNSRQSLRAAAGNPSGVELFGLSGRLQGGGTERHAGDGRGRMHDESSVVFVRSGSDSTTCSHVQHEGTIATSS